MRRVGFVVAGVIWGLVTSRGLGLDGNVVAVCAWKQVGACGGVLLKGRGLHAFIS